MQSPTPQLTLLMQSKTRLPIQLTLQLMPLPKLQMLWKKPPPTLLTL